MTSNVVRVNGDYKVQLAQGGTITFDATTSGNVVVNGNLTVTGTTTTVNSVETTIQDNVITLNSGQTGTAGVTGSSPYTGKSGFDIFRGTAPADGRGNAQIFWDESLIWDDSNTATTVSGAFVFKTSLGGLSAIRANAIGHNSANLTLLVGTTGVVTIRGAVNYETLVINDNDIPNKRYVDIRVGTVPTFTSTALRATPGSTGQLAAVSDGTPSGILAFWDVTNSRWSYVYNNSAV